MAPQLGQGEDALSVVTGLDERARDRPVPEGENVEERDFGGCRRGGFIDPGYRCQPQRSLNSHPAASVGGFSRVGGEARTRRVGIRL